MTQDPQEVKNLWNDPQHASVKLKLQALLLDFLAGQELTQGSRGGEAPTRAIESKFVQPIS